MICKYSHHVLLLPVLSAFFLVFFFPFPWSLTEADEKRLSHVQGQGRREWKRKISCTVPLLTGTSSPMVYVCVIRRRVSFLPLKNRSKNIASILSSLTIFHCFWKIWTVYSQPVLPTVATLLSQVVCSKQVSPGLPKSLPQAQTYLQHENQQCSPTGRRIWVVWWGFFSSTQCYMLTLGSPRTRLRSSRTSVQKSGGL